MMNNMGNFMPLVQELQEQLKKMTVKVSAGEGAVQIVMNGNQEVVQLHFKPESVQDPARLAQLTTEAFNEGMRESKKMVREQLSKLTGGLAIPTVPGLI
ncbi:YbaB/EbfC family nucleoid-associated protein [Desulfoscipio gibsoniae]|uniref:Nucleoid-associated protein Desgi_0110 n=1 Tax=Desulfoscipio gibsoniae DSM 7213 TaxID=767817 RepID=R4KGS8_9FIRM|nr:YbaB/EbfC family nucleoid-associated protein [Desulfoscipio gibsoniae]AGK99724.1 DNA-binding protein, YbaB/EbfC family [Desulfoscipio gibsoniae DSM 7213]